MGIFLNNNVCNKLGKLGGCRWVISCEYFSNHTRDAPDWTHLYHSFMDKYYDEVLKINP
jgi:hypothetical protein